MAGRDPVVYKPSTLFRATAFVAAAIFLALAAATFVLEFGRLYEMLAWVFAGIGLLAIIECLVEKVVLEEDSIRIVELFRRESISYRDIELVSIDGGRTALRLRIGRWRHLPVWLGASRSLHHQVTRRIHVGSAVPSAPVDRFNSS